MTSQVLRFSTNDYSERDRTAACFDFFGRAVAGLVFEPATDSPLLVEATVHTLEDLHLSSHSSMGLKVSLTPSMVSNDDLVLTSTSLGSWRSFQLGRETELGSNDAVLTSNADAGWQIQPGRRQGIAIRIPRARAMTRIPHFDAVLGQRIAANNGALTLLHGYLSTLRMGPALSTPRMRTLVRDHVVDLIALVVGTAGDANEAAMAGGFRAALLQAIKSYIESNLDGKLSVESVAGAHRLSVRKVQRLFEDEGTTLTEFIRNQRLLRAHGMLTNVSFAHRQIADIAFEAGFGDLSNFNRLFRRRFGASPSDVRASRLNGGQTDARPI
jgi:AraC-like DNA-binding protein